MKVQKTIGNLVLGASMIALIGDASAAAEAVASLEEMSGKTSITQAGNEQEGFVGMDLHDGDVASAASASEAVIQFTSGCRYKLKANESLEIDGPGPCCLDTAVSDDENEVVASFGRIEGKSMADLGAGYVPGREGLGLKVGNRAIALTGGTATILFTNGCRYRLRDDEVLKIDRHGPCCAAVIPSEKVSAMPIAGSVDPKVFLGLAAAGIGICALTECGGGGGGGGGGGERPSNPNTPISP